MSSDQRLFRVGESFGSESSQCSTSTATPVLLAEALERLHNSFWYCVDAEHTLRAGRKMKEGIKCLSLQVALKSSPPTERQVPETEVLQTPP